MAPSHGMLSHLRFHRSPSSPALDQQPSPSSLHSQQSPFTPNGVSPLDAQAPQGGGASSQPLVLPPIPSVTTTSIDLESPEKQDAKSVPSDGPSSQASRSTYNAVSGFIGGVAFRKHRRDASAQSPRGEGAEDSSSIREPRPGSVQPEPPARPLSRILTSSKSTSLLNIASEKRNSSTTSLRPSNSRLSIEPPPPPPLSKNVPIVEAKKGKKSLPFLKNPMSTLLMRRRANQSSKIQLPLPLGGRSEEPAYDPRIKGTRVHDFSAPRRKDNAPVSLIPTTLSTTQLNLAIDTRIQYSQRGVSPELLRGTSRQYSNASDSSGFHPGSTTTPHPILKSSSVSTIGTQLSFVEQPLPTGKEKSSPPAPPQDGVAPSLPQTNSGNGSRATGSVRTTRSRNLSLSSIPRHMRSTSSRFSFDMIGSANQEKLLEDRHRQRELGKKAAAADAPRNSMYDDFDEDGFDYDAMMDDDGLEERIPGVNADYEDDEFYDEDQSRQQADPDDDQENFAGFVFQRSNPGSSAVRSPTGRGSLLEPRDARNPLYLGPPQPDANLPDSQPFFGSPEMEKSESSHRVPPYIPRASSRVNVDAPYPHNDPNVQTPVQLPTAGRGFTEDDLYFGGDLTGFEDDFAEDLAAEPDGDNVPFDESIFDDNDTDQFGRPLPGAFALAQSLRRAAHQQSTKRPSFMASKLQSRPEFPPSAGAGEVSTGPESCRQSIAEGAEAGVAVGDGTGLEKKVEEEQEDEIADETLCAAASDRETELVAPIPTSSSGSVEAVYQAALAAAAQKAAASGKFERSKSPSHGGAVDRGEALGDLDPLSFGYPDPSEEDFGYVDDGIGDDDELDDDAIIAEANASALANDADGWYGQEFGFYSTPINIHGSQNADVDYSYANGGFFGPKGLGGLDRSASGRVASREPNLTPITERSEYSNRNSVMSMGVPNGNSGTPTMQSPGLAQLAMLADRGDDLTLSALLRLRSRAWGDSQASLVSSSKDGSPRSERGGEAQNSPRGGPFAGGPHLGSNGVHGRKNSVFSVVSRDSDAMSAPASPGLRLAIPMLPSDVPAEEGGPSGHAAPHPSRAGDFSRSMCASPSALQEAPQLTAQATRNGQETSASAAPRPGAQAQAAEPTPDGNSPIVSFAARSHRRQKGSADSISYTQEEESGGTRWVMERRRTGECGQVELVEREVVEGGRI